MFCERMIPISKPLLGKEEGWAVKRVLDSGSLTQDEEIRRFEEEFSKYMGTKFAVATSSGTSALHMVLLSFGIGRGMKHAKLSRHSTEGIAYLDYLKQNLEVYSGGKKPVPKIERDEPLKPELQHFLDCIQKCAKPAGRWLRRA